MRRLDCRAVDAVQLNRAVSSPSTLVPDAAATKVQRRVQLRERGPSQRAIEGSAVRSGGVTHMQVGQLPDGAQPARCWRHCNGVKTQSV